MRCDHRFAPCESLRLRSLGTASACRIARLAQSTFAPDAFTIRAYFGISRAMNAANCSGVVGAGFRALRGQALAHVGRVEYPGDLGVPLGDHVLRRAGRREQAVPRRDVEARQARFGHRRQVGRERRARGGRHRQRLQLAGLDLRRGVGEVVEHELDVAGEQRLRRRRAALVRNVDDVGAGVDLEQLAGEMPGAAVAARTERQLARIGLGVGDELLDRIHRQRRVDHQHVRRGGEQRDRHEILDRDRRASSRTGSDSPRASTARPAGSCSRRARLSRPGRRRCCRRRRVCCRQQRTGPTLP